MWILFCLLGVLVFGVFGGARAWRDTAARRQDPRLHLERGRALYRAHHYPEAARELRAALRAQPDLAEAHLGLGMVLQQSGQAGAAEQFYEAWALQPDNPRYAGHCGEALLREGDLARAEAPAARLIAVQPSDPRSLLLFAKVASGLPLNPERQLQLKNALRRLRALAPRNAETHYLLGLLSLNTNRLAEARTHLQRCLRLDPEHEAALYNLGRLYLRQGDPSAAQKYLDKFRALDTARYRETLKMHQGTPERP